MRPRAVYVIGGPGSGKTTFVRGLVTGLLDTEFGARAELQAAPKSNGAVVRLWGHPFWGGRGVLLGSPERGTDAVDKAVSPAALAWLQGELPEMILGEGLRFTTRGFITELAQQAHLLLIHLQVGEEERARRFRARGTEQKPSWVAGATKQVDNLARWWEGPRVSVDTELDASISDGMRTAAEWLDPDGIL